MRAEESEMMSNDEKQMLLDGLARMVENARDAMVRSKPTMTVKEHRGIMTSVAEGIRKGLVAL
jgi:hypothetical protein